MKRIIPAFVLVLAASVAMPAVGGNVSFQVSNGLVTLQARDATLREILAEWARVGQVKFVNLDRVSGGPVTIELQAVPGPGRAARADRGARVDRAGTELGWTGATSPSGDSRLDLCRGSGVACRIPDVARERPESS